MRLMSAMYNYKPAFYGYTIPKRDFKKDSQNENIF